MRNLLRTQQLQQEVGSRRGKRPVASGFSELLELPNEKPDLGGSLLESFPPAKLNPPDFPKEKVEVEVAAAGSLGSDPGLGVSAPNAVDPREGGGRLWLAGDGSKAGLPGVEPYFSPMFLRCFS